METVRPLITKALALIPATDGAVAIDFGIGTGEETGALLHHGYSVIAIDNFKEFLDEVRLRKDVQPHLTRLHTIQANFEELDWNLIPPVDLFVASFSLCFIQPEKFQSIWHHIVKQIKPGGYFIGELYTHLQKNTQIDGFFTEESSELVPLFTEKELRELLKDFESIYFAEAKELYEVQDTGHSEDGTIYSVIARRKELFSS